MKMIRITVNVDTGTWKLLVILHRVTNMVSVWVLTIKALTSLSLCRGVGKRDIWGAGFLAIPGFNTGDGAMPQAIAGNYWREDRTDAFYPAAYNLAGSNTGFNMQTQDRYLLNMSYFRIKNITLGYTLPAVWTKKVLINKARIYVACENFFTFDKLGGLPIDAEEISGFYVQLYKL